jgi:hypothetical protein
VNRDILWKIMENKISNSILKAIKYIYRDMKVHTKFDDDTISAPIQINQCV